MTPAEFEKVLQRKFPGWMAFDKPAAKHGLPVQVSRSLSELRAFLGGTSAQLLLNDLLI